MLDVSIKAGVSKSTVSRVLNGTAKISDETRQAVFDAVEALNYRPNVLARSLAKQQTNTIGLVIPRGAGSSQYLGLLIEICQDLAEQIGKDLIITQIGDSQAGLFNSIRSLVDRRCDAVLYYNNSFFDQNDKNSELLSNLIDELPVPLVVINCFLPRHQDQCVWFDHVLGARLPVDYLIKNGHTKIAYIAGPLNQRTAQLRLQGYENALRDAGITINGLLVVEGDRYYSGGYSAFNQLLDRKTDFTAVCCFNDMTAIGALHAMKERKINVPEQVSIIGFDNENVLDYLTPSISSVQMSLQAFVTYAMKILISKLNNENSTLDEFSPFAAELIIRDSVRSY